MADMDGHSGLPEGNEISFEEAYGKFWKDASFHDVSLQCDDGVRVPACRHALAARNKVFQTMLLGSYQEASSPLVKLGYKGVVVKAIVEYICTNKAEILQGTTDDFGSMETIISLAGAAVYFDLPGLCRKSYDCFQSKLSKTPELAFSALQAFSKTGPCAPEPFQKLVMKHVSYETMSKYLHLLSPSSFQIILQCDEINIDECKLFELLVSWVGIPGENSLPAVLADSADTPTSKEERHAVALELTKNIRLELIDPELLSTTVASSGLVTSDQLLNAFQAQALASKKVHGPAFKKRRCNPLPVWKSSSTDVSASNAANYGTDLLQCPTKMTSGTYRWVIKVEAEPGDTWLGVTSAVPKLDMNKNFGSQDGGWVYGSCGSAYRAGSLCGNHQTFTQGATVTFQLDLTEMGNGKLDASVDGGPTFRLFSGMRAEWNGQEGTFVPAVSQQSPGRVRLLDFEKLSD